MKISNRRDHGENKVLLFLTPHVQKLWTADKKSHVVFLISFILVLFFKCINA